MPSDRYNYSKRKFYEMLNALDKDELQNTSNLKPKPS